MKKSKEVILISFFYIRERERVREREREFEFTRNLGAGEPFPAVTAVISLMLNNISERALFFVIVSKITHFCLNYKCFE